MNRLSLVLLLALTAAAAATGTTHAQSGGSGGRALAPGVKVEVEGAGAPAAAGTVDETALRYYARIGDVGRLEAEIARLKAIDPSWQPPKDLFAPPTPQQPGVNEKPFWDLVAAGRYAEARAAIAEQRRTSSGWQPSDALLRELALGEATQRVKQASDAKRPQDVVDAATAEPRVLACNRLDTLWRTAEAYAQLKQPDRAFELYRTAVTTCAKASERRDTLFKAGQNLPPERVRDLAALAETSNPKVGEDYAIVRRAMDELDVGRTLEALGAKGTNPPAEDLARAEANVLERKDGEAALALGWFYQGRKQYGPARDWFQRANEWAPGDRPVEGLVLALVGLGRKEEAVAAAEPWKGRSPRVDAALRAARPPSSGGGGGGPSGPSPLDRAVAARDWGRCLELIQREQAAKRLTAVLAQQRGWCLMELKRPMEAEQAFAEAKALVATAPAVERAKLADVAVYGGFVARIGQDDAVGVLHDLPTSGLSPERRLEVKASALAAQALRAYQEERYRDTLRLLDARRELQPETRGLSMIRGWTLYALSRHADALDLFEALDRRLSTEETQNAVSTVRQAIYRGG